MPLANFQLPTSGREQRGILEMKKNLSPQISREASRSHRPMDRGRDARELF
jgi:hypothetical protein